MRRRRLALGIFGASLSLLGLLLSGCSTTKAYQREHLAHPVMSPDLQAEREALRSHVRAVREGAAGGFGGGGGGCGCN